jgi:hypothetical protein
MAKLSSSGKSRFKACKVSVGVIPSVARNLALFESFPESYVKIMSFELGQISHFVRNDSWRGFCTPRKGPLTEFFRNLLVEKKRGGDFMPAVVEALHGRVG